MLIGETRLIQSGVAGTKTNYYNVTYYNGVETAREWTHSEVTTAPINEVVAVGTQDTEIKSEIKVENEVDFSTTEELDSTIPNGERVIVQEGAKGYDTVTYDVSYVNGVEMDRTETLRITTAPIAQIVKIGTKLTADITKPVIDFSSVKVSSNTVSSGESVTFSVAINDDRGISSAYVYYSTPITDKTEYIKLYKNSLTGLFEGSLQITNLTETGVFKIKWITATDTSKNTVDLYNSSVDGYYFTPAADLSSGNFSVSGTNADITKPVIDFSSVKVSSNTVSSGESVTFSVAINDDRGISSAYVYYSTPITDKTEYIKLYKNSLTGLFEGSLQITNLTETGVFKIKWITATDTSKNTVDLYNSSVDGYYFTPAADLSSGNFSVSGTNADITKPVIDFSSVKVSSNTVSSGESVTFSVAINDDRGISSAYVYYSTPITDKTEYIKLYKNSLTGLFEGSLQITNLTETGVFKIKWITATDTSKNTVDLYNSSVDGYYFTPAADLSSGNINVI